MIIVDMENSCYDDIRLKYGRKDRNLQHPGDK